MARARAHMIASLLLTAGLIPALLPGTAGPAVPKASNAPSAVFNPKSVPVYVSLFDINAGPGKEPVAATQSPAPQKPQAGKHGAKESPHVLQNADTSAKQAERLKGFFGDELIQALKKSGFPASLQGSSRPEKGVLLRGVFVEVDSQNHNCLAILGGATPAPKFLVYVGVYNLARPDQPLYRVMTMETCDAQFGPVISLNNYIPMDKYEVGKSPTEDEVRKICAQIVKNLRDLLSVNSAAFSD